MRLLSRWAVIAAVALGACSSDTKEYAPAPDDTTTTSTTAAVGVDASAYVESGDYVNGRHLAYLTAFDEVVLTFDVVQFLTGEAAAGADNDYVIRNENKQLRTLEAADDVVIRMNISAGYEPSDPDKGHEVTARELAAFVKAGNLPPFWITIKDGKIAAIEEQYLP